MDVLTGVVVLAMVWSFFCSSVFFASPVYNNTTPIGIIGACEDQDEHEIRAQFTTNVMGTINIIQLTLPYFRAHHTGIYLLFSSTAGSVGIPGLGPYCATKWAIEGLAESLMYEVEPLGVKVSIVVPGLSRRDEPDENLNGPAPMWGHFLLKPPEDAYRATTSPAQHATRMIDWLKYREPTSAVRCAEIVWEVCVFFCFFCFFVCECVYERED